MATEGEAATADEVNGTLEEVEEQQPPHHRQVEEDDDEQGNEAEGDEEEEAEDEYTFRFTDRMSPLDFVHNDDSCVQLYQQFERLEYEALADRNRKALSDSQTKGTPSEKATEDHNPMNFAMCRRSRKPKKSKSVGREGWKNKLNPQLTRMLGDATLHYARGCHDQAIAALHEVVWLAPNLPHSYHTLGLIYTSLEDYKRAMGFHMIAAHLTPKDSSLWKMLFTWSIEQGDISQASYCLSKAITADPKDTTLWNHRALLYTELGDHQKAAAAYEQLHQLCTGNVDALTAAAKGTDASHVNEAMDPAATFASMTMLS